MKLVPVDRDGKVRVCGPDGRFARMDAGTLTRLPVITLPWIDERPRDACGRPRAAVTMPSYRRGKSPGNAGLSFPPTPPTPEEVVRIIDAFSKTSPAGIRNRALTALLWRSGLRISEALALYPEDLNPDENSVLVRCGKGGKRRISGLDDFGFELIAPWLERRPKFPPGFLFCVCEGVTKGRPMRAAYFRSALKEAARRAGVNKRIAPHQLRHGHACDLAREGVSVIHISKQLGHGDIGITSTYLQGIAPMEVLNVIAARPRPELPPPEEA